MINFCFRRDSNWKLMRFAIQNNLDATFEASWDENLGSLTNLDPNNPIGGNALDCLISLNAHYYNIQEILTEVIQLLVNWIHLF